MYADKCFIIILRMYYMHIFNKQGKNQTNLSVPQVQLENFLI